MVTDKQTPTKRTLRRKPPPLQRISPEQHKPAQFPYDTPILTPINDHHQNYSEPAHSTDIYSPVIPPYPQTSPLTASLSSKPMGPRELPEYDANVENYDPLYLQTLPYPTSEPVFLQTLPYPATDPFTTPTRTPSHIPVLEGTTLGLRGSPSLRKPDVSPQLYTSHYESPYQDEYQDSQEFTFDATYGNYDTYGEPYNEGYKDNYADYQQYENDSESPTSKLFDYSALPDLPSAITLKYEGEGSPTKRLTLNSAISFVKDQSYFDSDALDSPTTRAKKKDVLPPVPLDLPALPFASSSLVSRHFSECPEVWSLLKIFAWCLKLESWVHNLLILKKEFKKAVIKLLVFHRRDVPLDMLGPSVDQIILSLVLVGAIEFDYGTTPNQEGDKPLPTPGETRKPTKTDPRVVFHKKVQVSGVLTDLTNCYCYKGDHKSDGKQKLRCISLQCYVNRVIDYDIKFRNTDISEIVLGADWASHWKLTAEDLKAFDKGVSKKQSLLFDLLRLEQTFIQRVKVFVEVVGPEFIKAVKTLVGSLEIILVNKFDDDVLNPGKELLQIHQKSLFEPLLKILISNGKFIKDIADIGNIYYNWSQVVKPALLKYMGTMPMIEELLNIPVIKQWVDINVRNIPRVKELGVNGPLLFMSTFNSRYQQLPLQFEDILKQFDENDSEYAAISKAIAGIRKTGLKVNEMKRHADNIHALRRIQKQLVWKNNVSRSPINFNSENRKFIFRGDLTRKGDLKINSTVNHVILLDNYLLITERLKSNKTPLLHYRVVENPIPVEFLLLEIRDKESPTIELNSITKLTSLPQQGPPKHELIVDQEDTSVYPFKIRFAGRGKSNAFVFSTKTERARSDWVDNIKKARSGFCQRLRRQEPYELQLISNTCFAYEESNKVTKLQVVAPNDPIESISSGSLETLTKLGYKGDIYSFNNASNHVVYSTICSGASFNYSNTNFYFIGSGSGVYCSDMVHEWKRVVLVPNTTKITVLVQMNLVIMLSGSSLRYYPLDVLINYYYGRRTTISSVALSNEAVSFYEIDKHREIPMLFYAKKKSSSGNTNFKVRVPETDNDGIFSAFKTIQKFYFLSECYGISIFNSSFAVHAIKGIEILELDKLLPRSVPDIPNVDTQSKKIDVYARRAAPAPPNSNEINLIKKSVFDSSNKPMGMFKLNNNSEFLLVYSECAVFINKHGKLLRFSMLRFDFKARSVALSDNNLFIVCEEAIEIWSISDLVKGSNRLIQVITGKDIQMVNPQQLICCMANPIIPGLQLVFKLVAK